jgi:hypothetical protein
LDRLRVGQTSKTFGTREELIGGFIKQKYLIKTKVNDQQGDEPEFLYTWGQRAKVELPEQNIVEFMTSVSLYIGRVCLVLTFIFSFTPWKIIKSKK